MKNRQVDKKLSMQVRLDKDLHRLLKIKVATDKTSIKNLLDDLVSKFLDVKRNL